MIRTRQERQADRDWCEQYMGTDRDIGDGVVFSVTIGCGLYLIAALLAGWL